MISAVFEPKRRFRLIRRNMKTRKLCGRKRSFSKMACIVFVFCAATVIASPAQSFHTLVNFDGTNGASPDLMSLVQGTDGRFYGTTIYGGANGVGTVFKMTAGGVLTTLHSFDGTDGNYPNGTLVQATDGDFYGTTSYGGDSNSCASGCGTVFKMTAGGVLTTLHSFDSTDGRYPNGGLVQGGDGNFYGTTFNEGSHNDCAGGRCGTVFKITPNGTLTTLHDFVGSDGENPEAGLVQGSDGNFYGTTYGGGTYKFLYGTVFKITAGGTLTTLHSFVGTDGENPKAGLVQGSDGNFYGTTSYGGRHGGGAVFKMTADGALTTLHSFDGSDGDTPFGGLVQATNGLFYGTTSSGGARHDGTVFSVSVGLASFVETQPTSGKVGAAVKILGTNLTGATSVSFHGTEAKFKVVSKSEITTEIPTGATTGKVKVKTPDGTLVSNVIFRVEP
jgi:uncharacterized repeat protein (TIGR03803 family)